MVSAQDWKTKLYLGPDDDVHVEAIEALASLLEGNVTPADAALKITKTYEASIKAVNGSSKEALYHDTRLHEFWSGYMSNAIRRFGGAEEQERLFELLVEISSLPDLMDDDGMVVKSDYRTTFWVDLPGWQFHFVDAGLYRESARDFRPEERELFFAQRQQFLNATRFAAILLSRNKFASALPPQTSYYLQKGLEHSWDENPEVTARVDRDEWETLIPVATTWLSIAGKAIYEHCHCQKEDLYGGWQRATWNLQRWNMWKQQLEKFAKRKDSNDECRDLASQTVKKMAEFEAGYQPESPSSETWWPTDAMEHELRSSNFPVE